MERLDEVVSEGFELVEPHARDDVLPHHARRHELAAVLHRRQAERRKKGQYDLSWFMYNDLICVPTIYYAAYFFPLIE